MVGAVSGMGPYVFMLVKYPEKGMVKVRLTHHIDGDVVIALYRNFVLDSLSMLERSGFTFGIYFHPPEALKEFEDWLGTQYEYIPQDGMDLGERLRNGFLKIFSRGFSKVLAIGSDSPDLPETILLEASKALEAHDAVLGPAVDGGYYLIGFRQAAFLPAAFQGIAWSTDTVFKRTVERLKGAGLTVHILPTWADVDTVDDLKDLVRRNKKSVFASSRTINCIYQNKDILGWTGV